MSIILYQNYYTTKNAPASFDLKVKSIISMLLRFQFILKNNTNLNSKFATLKKEKSIFAKSFSYLMNKDVKIKDYFKGPE